MFVCSYSWHQHSTILTIYSVFMCVSAQWAVHIIFIINYTKPSNFQMHNTQDLFVFTVVVSVFACALIGLHSCMYTAL